MAQDYHHGVRVVEVNEGTASGKPDAASAHYRQIPNGFCQQGQRIRGQYGITTQVKTPECMLSAISIPAALR